MYLVTSLSFSDLLLKEQKNKQFIAQEFKHPRRKCTICNYTVSYSNFKRHLRNAHPNEYKKYADDETTITNLSVVDPSPQGGAGEGISRQPSGGEEEAKEVDSEEEEMEEEEEEEEVRNI